MGKTKEPVKSKKKPGRAGKPQTVSAGKKRPPVYVGAPSEPKRPKKAKPPAPSAPLTDEQLGPVPGIPTEAQIEEAVGPLSPDDRAAFERVKSLLAEHLGSHAAARLWLASPGPEFQGIPLDAIRRGQAGLLLSLLESDWGPSPGYA